MTDYNPQERAVIYEALHVKSKKNSFALTLYQDIVLSAFATFFVVAAFQYFN